MALSNLHCVFDRDLSPPMLIAEGVSGDKDPQEIVRELTRVTPNNRISSHARTVMRREKCERHASQLGRELVENGL